MNKDLYRKHPIVIAVDGYSSSGKSSMAKALAKRIGYRYIDSGAMYRAVTLYALENDLIESHNDLIVRLNDIHIDFKVNEDGSQNTYLNDRNVEQDIRGMAVSNFVSDIAAIPEVRHEMVRKQQEFGLAKGIVMDGRDIGTTVFPKAELKIFVEASPETRAQRRYDELKKKGIENVTYQEVLQNIVTRDYTDTHREESPLVCADDAVILDNSHMSIEEQNNWVDNLLQKKFEELHS